jgi:tRNA (guanine-N7-)-methyltransferase
VTSKYEARWLRQEKDIFDVYVKCLTHSDPKALEIDFNFNGVKYSEGIEEKLSKEAMVFDGFFIHFERLFKIGDEKLLIKCAFGSFDRPEHKYILMGKEGCRYFASVPVKTMVNHRAHQKMREIFLQGDQRV